MPSSRVIRPARVLAEKCPVSVPEPGDVGPDAGDAACDPARREQDLARALTEMEERWKERERRFAEELSAVEERSREEVSRAVGRLSSVVEDFLAQREDIIRSSEETVVRIATALARKIVGEVVEVDAEVVLRTLRSALQHVIDKQAIVIRVHPDDLKVVREHKSEWLSTMEGARSLEIEEDERVRRGGCLVETEAGNVEAQIDRQIQALERVLLEKAR